MFQQLKWSLCHVATTKGKLISCFNNLSEANIMFQQQKLNRGKQKIQEKFNIDIQPNFIFILLFKNQFQLYESW